MIQPVLQDDAFLADVAAGRAEGDASRVRLWWLGQSGFLVQWHGGHLLLDPYLSDSLTRKYAETDKPHTRMMECIVDPARLDFIDAVTTSHNHTDHLDAQTLLPLLKANSSLKVIAPEANRLFVAARLEMDTDALVTMDDGVTRHVAGFTIHGVPAAHETLDQDEMGHHRTMGYVIQLDLEQKRKFTIYHSGDTLLYEGMVERLRPFAIDLALLPINGRAPERRVAGNLWGREAALLASEVAAKLVVPCHYDMFTFNTATPDEFVHECERLRQPYRVLLAGERLTL